MQLFYGDDSVYDVQLFDEVAVVGAGDFRITGYVKQIHPRRRELTIGFDQDNPILQLLALKTSARVPFAAVEFIGRSA